MKTAEQIAEEVTYDTVNPTWCRRDVIKAAQAGIDEGRHDEFICTKCGLRQNSTHQPKADF